MNAAIRVDASDHIGSGHVMRCLSLAGVLRARGDSVTFICRNAPGNLIDLIEQTGYPVLRLPDTASWEKDARMTCGHTRTTDWLIVDHYALDRRWEQELGKHVKKILVIDDLANRPHACNLLLDQNFYEDAETRYNGLVPGHCSMLLGPQFALLRPEFAATRERLRPRDGSVRRILLFFGAGDGTNETGKALAALKQLNRPELAVDVVIGVNNPHRASIEALAASLPGAGCHAKGADMAALMAAADLYLGAAGTTTWERCCLGLPSLIVTVAENQVRAVQDLANRGYVRYIGHHASVSINDIVQALLSVIDDSTLLRNYAKRSGELVDGLGSQRCADMIRST